MSLRSLTTEEIEILQSQGCTAGDWDKVRVASAGFVAGRYRRVDFLGSVTLGVTSASGFRDAVIRDCNIGDNVSVSSVSGEIAGYDIGNDVELSGIGRMICTGRSTFGIGTPVHVMNEAGGREVPLSTLLSAQTAYLIAMYRHDKALVTALTEMIMKEAGNLRGKAAVIGNGVSITDTGTIRDVNFADNCRVTGALALTDGSVGEEACIGSGVSAARFVIASQALVDTNSIIHSSFIGQAVKIENGMTVNDSLIFANCELACGECEAIFAAPHTISKHKSTLLIGGFFGFFNAGSGTNQSNHLYRLGPVHQGVMERGCKTGSDSYVMWPARFGQFSIISGRHYHHPDTSSLPYSYIFERDGATLVLPAANIKTAGTLRDMLKWQRRDGRSKKINRLDAINYRTLSPLTVKLMYQAIGFLNDYVADNTKSTPLNFVIHPDYIRRGRELYALTVDFFMGETLLDRLEKCDFSDPATIPSQLQTDSINTDTDVDRWVDIAGLVAPVSLINKVADEIKAGKLGDLASVNNRLHAINDDYDLLAWQYAVLHFYTVYKVAFNELTPEILISIIRRWSESVRGLARMRHQDACKDFAADMRTGYGIDNPSDSDADFEAVRGTLSTNSIVKLLMEHYDGLLQRGENMMQLLQKVSANC